MLETSASAVFFFTMAILIKLFKPNFLFRSLANEGPLFYFKTNPFIHLQ